LANLQIKGMDDELYARLKAVAASQNRSISQEVVHLVRAYLSNRKTGDNARTPGQTLLELAGSLEDDRDAETIVADLKAARRHSSKSVGGF